MQFLLQVQELRHCILSLPQVQQLHVEPTPLHLHVAVTVLQVTAVAGGLGHQFIVFSSVLMFQPHSNFDEWGWNLPGMHFSICVASMQFCMGVFLEDPN